jgi:peptidoglycan-N-acetylglucosamine deacetylase
VTCGPARFAGVAAVLLLVGLTAALAASGATPETLRSLAGHPAPASRAMASLDTIATASPSPSPARSYVSTASAPGGSPAATPSPSASSGTAAPSSAVTTAPQAKAVYNGSRAKKVVALTFDDGYNPTALRQILAILKREHVTATFFPCGWAVHADPVGWHMVVEAGFPIGNHTLTHATLTQLTPDQVTSELVRGHRTIDLYSGGKSVALMRPPGGAWNAETARASAKAGYQTIVMWDVDTFDWQGPSAATILARAIKGTNGSIVLMHAGPLNTPKALPAIIANYRARGFTFVTVPQLLAAR